jgi:hypothetical protein
MINAIRTTVQCTGYSWASFNSFVLLSSLKFDFFNFGLLRQTEPHALRVMTDGATAYYGLSPSFKHSFSKLHIFRKFSKFRRFDRFFDSFFRTVRKA